MAEMLKNNLNINVEVSSNEWSIFYDDVQKGNYQVAAMGWSADYVNPMSFLPLCKNRRFFQQPVLFQRRL